MTSQTPQSLLRSGGKTGAFFSLDLSGIIHSYRFKESHRHQPNYPETLKCLWSAPKSI